MHENNFTSAKESRLEIIAPGCSTTTPALKNAKGSFSRWKERMLINNIQTYESIKVSITVRIYSNSEYSNTVMVMH